MKSKFNIGIVLGIMLLLTAFVSAGNLSISSVDYNPSPAYAGTYIYYTAHVYNDSYSTASDVKIKFELSKNNSYSEYPFSFDSNEASEKSLGDLPAYQSAIVNYRIRIDPTALDGAYTINIEVKEGDSAYKMTPFTITIQNRKPVLSVESVLPDEMIIGKKTEMNLSITNNGSSAANDISIGIGEDRTVTQAGAVVERTIIPIGTAFTHVESIAPNETVSVKIPIMINPGTAPKAYFVPIEISFYDENKTKYSDVDYIGVKAYNESGINAMIASVTPKITPQNKSKITIDISNTDMGAANAVSVKITSTAGTVEPMEYYIGSLNPENLYAVQTDLTVPKNTASGTYSLNAEIKFKDAFGEEKIENVSLPFVVHTNEELGITDPVNFTQIFLAIGLVFVLGMGYIFRKNIINAVKKRE